MKGKEPWKPSEAQGKWSKKDQVGPKRGGVHRPHAPNNGSAAAQRSFKSTSLND